MFLRIAQIIGAKLSLMYAAFLLYLLPAVRGAAHLSQGEARTLVVCCMAAALASAGLLTYYAAAPLLMRHARIRRRLGLPTVWVALWRALTPFRDGSRAIARRLDFSPT